MPRFPRGGSGSGGAEFAFDGATFTPGDFEAGSGAREITVTLTLDGTPVGMGIYCVTYRANRTDNYAEGFECEPSSNAQDCAQNGGYGGTCIYWQEGEGEAYDDLVFEVNNPAGGAVDAYFYVSLPSGEFAQSDAISIPGS